MRMHPVKRARLRAGLNLRELSDQSHLSIPTLGRIESGELVTDLSMHKAANALGLDGEELVEAMHEATSQAALEHKQPA
jgi:transcriptional regulator with XRE-family HTH domain